MTKQGLFYVLDYDTYNVIYIIEDYKYALWNIRYDDVSDFEIQIPLDKSKLEYLKIDNYIKNPDAPDEYNVMILETYEIVFDESGEKLLKISGRSPSSFLSRRIFGIDTYINGNIEDSIKQMIKYHFYTTAVNGPFFPNGFTRTTDEKVENLSFIYSDNSAVTGSTVKFVQFSPYDTLLDGVKKLIEYNDLGFRMYFDPTYGTTVQGVNASNRFVFELIKGANRSDKIVFSVGMDNLVCSNYKRSFADYKNYLATYGYKYNDRNTFGVRQFGQDWGYNFSPYSGTVLGLKIREAGVDESSVTWESTDVYGNTTTISSTDYFYAHDRRCQEDLISLSYTEEAESKIIETPGHVFNKDFFIGDIVGVDDGIDNRIKMIVSEYIISYDQNGIVSYPKFKVFKKTNLN